MRAHGAFADVICAGIAIFRTRNTGSIIGKWIWFEDASFCRLTSINRTRVAVVADFWKRDRTGFVFARVVERTLIVVVAWRCVCDMRTLSRIAHIFCANVSFVETGVPIL